jgi:phosphoserine phosphatase RsbU/P
MDNYLSNAPCLFFQTTEENVITGFNQTFLNTTGYAETDLINGAKTDLFFPVATKIFQQTHLFPLLKLQGEVQEIFISLKGKNGEALPLLINASRININGEVQVLYCGIIVRNRNKFEEELIAAKKKVEKALLENTALSEAKLELQKHAEQLDNQLKLIKNQNKTLVQFNKVVSHDMQEPLRKIRIFSDMLTNMNEKEKIDQTITKIGSAAAIMQKQLQRLQQFLWLSDSTLNKEYIATGKLVELAGEQLKKEFHDRSWNIKVSEGPNLYGDPTQLQILIYQIINNSIRFSNREETAISVSTYMLKLNKFHEINNKYKYIDYVRLEITDNGPGFDSNYADDVFNLFSRIQVQKNPGTGLTFCKKIADLHDGSINLETKPGIGTTVMVNLPLDQ